MDRIKVKTKIIELARKYAHIILILAVGLLLMIVPSKKSTPAQQQITAKTSTPSTLEERLTNILSMVAGAGEVQVMLSQASGEETLYQTDNNYSTANESGTGRQDTVTITDSERNETGLVRQINPPAYMGAIILCDGADIPSVRLAIVEAVAAVTGIGADKISVLKMK